MTNQQVVDAFVDGETSGSAGHLFIEPVRDSARIDSIGHLRDSVVIYSYGYHFPLAVRTSDLFAFVNSDKYSQTTSCHMGRVLRSLARAGIETEAKTTKELQTIIKNGLA